RDFADEDRTGFDLRADADDARLVQVAQHILPDVRDVARDLFRPQLRVARFDLQLLNVDRSVVIVLHQTLGDEDRVLEVVTAPRHESDEDVPAQSQLTAICARPVRDHLPLRHALADSDNRALIDTGVLVRPLEFGQRVDVRRHLARDRAVHIMICADDDALTVNVIHHTVAARGDNRARIRRRHLLHARADVWRFGAEQRHTLALHVRSHQRAVRVVVLKERDERGGDRDELFWTDVHILDLIAQGENELARFARGVALVDDVARLVKLDVRLPDDVLILFPSGQVERVRLMFGLTPVCADALVRAHDLIFVDVVARLVFRVAAVDDAHVFDDPARFNLAIRRLDEAELVDTREA